MTNVKYFSNVWTGAPQLSGQLGSLVSLLDSCLVNGFGETDIQSISVISGFGTVQSNLHKMRMIDSETGCVGIFTGGDLDGTEFRTHSITNENEFVFKTNLANGIYTATTVKIAPLGWQKIHGDSQRACYRRTNPDSTPMTLQVDDHQNNNSSYLYVHEGIQPTISYWSLPTSPVTYCYKSDSANTRNWRLIGDDRTFYFHCDASNNNTYSYGFSFGDICPGMLTDKFNCMIIANSSTSSSNYNYSGHVDGNSTGSWIFRAANQMGSSIPLGRYSHRRFSVMGNGGIINPNPVDGLIHLWQVEAWDMGFIQQYRGIMRGLYCPIHYFIHESTFRGNDGKKYISLDGYNSARMVYDLEGPWV